MASRLRVDPKIIMLLVMIFMACTLFMPSTIIFFFGMMPTWAIMAGDRSRAKMKTVGIGLMNVAGVSYVLMLLWTTGHTVDNALELVLNVYNMVAMYGAAAGGYFVQKAMTGIVAQIILAQTQIRLKFLKKQQGKLEERWGEEVSGRIPLDAYGFPIQMDGPVSSLAEEDDGESEDVSIDLSEDEEE